MLIGVSMMVVARRVPVAMIRYRRKRCRQRWGPFVRVGAGASGA